MPGVCGQPSSPVQDRVANPMNAAQATVASRRCDDGVSGTGGAVQAFALFVVVALVLASMGCAPSVETPGPALTATGEWWEFEGSWNGVGNRRSIQLGADRRGAILDLKGTMLLARPGHAGGGFHAEVIALVDTETGLVGRGVWTDEHGDQVFSELTGEGTAAKNLISGNILGGTGRYAGATGTYEFSWEYVIDAGDGLIQGRASGLKGRLKTSQPGMGGGQP